MSKAEIHSGACGFTTVVEAKMNGKACKLVIESDCIAIQKLAEDLTEVNPIREIAFGRTIPQTIQ